MKNLLLFLLAATLFACTKDQDENKFDLDDFFDKHKPKEQVFTVSGDSVYWKRVFGENGGIIEFNTGKFRDINNNPVTGNVTMKVIEVYKTSDIILSGLHTITYSYQLLKSNGMLNIQFGANGQQAKAVTNMKISVPPVSNFFRGLIYLY